MYIITPTITPSTWAGITVVMSSLACYFVLYLVIHLALVFCFLYTYVATLLCLAIEKTFCLNSLHHSVSNTRLGCAFSSAPYYAPEKSLASYSVQAAACTYCQNNMRPISISLPSRVMLLCILRFVRHIDAVIDTVMHFISRSNLDAQYTYSKLQNLNYILLKTILIHRG